MAEILDKSYWIINENGLLVLGRPAGARLSDTFDAINSDLDIPIKLYAAQTPDAKLYIRQQSTPMGDGGAKSTGPLASIIPSFNDSTIDFQTQATTGSPIAIAFPASTVGRFRRCAFSLDNTGTLVASFSAEALSVGALANAGGLFLANAFPIGWVDLECTNVVGRFKTAGSASNVIQNAVSGTPRIFRIGAGGGGSGGSNSGISQEVAIGPGIDTFTVTFPSPALNTYYVPEAQLFNDTDPNPQFLNVIVTAKTINGFTVRLNVATDSANYKLSYIVPALQMQQGSEFVGNGVSSAVVTLPIAVSGTMYSVIAQLANYVDAEPQFQPVTITARTTTTFTARWNNPTDSTNYQLAFHMAEWT